MTRLLDPVLAGRRVLLVVAVEAEANAVRRGLEQRPAQPAPRWARVELNHRFDMIVSGVGKANAAGATAHALDPMRHAVVLNLGVAGALPREPAALDLGAVILGTRSTFADEGMHVPGQHGFRSLAQMGFAPLPDPADGMSVHADPALLEALAPVAAARAAIATVSTCSACDALAAEMVRRTGAEAEAMEGAAVGTSAQALGLRFLEIRAISNTTGDRDAQRWDISAALDSLARVAAAL